MIDGYILHEFVRKWYILDGEKRELPQLKAICGAYTATRNLCITDRSPIMLRRSRRTLGRPRFTEAATILCRHRFARLNTEFTEELNQEE